MFNAFDVIIIGGGPGGYKVAELLGREHLKVALIEEKDLGGVCLNQGCIPFKSYIYPAKVLHEARRLSSLGLLHTFGIDIDQRQLFAYKTGIVEALRKSVKGMLQHFGVSLFHGRATVIDEQNDREIQGIPFHVCINNGSNNEVIEASNLVIASGSDERRFEIPKNLSYKIIGSKEMLELTQIPEEIDIIGAGVIGLEAASYFCDAGSKVTLIEALSHIGGNIDTEVAQSLKNIFEKKGITILTEVRLENFEQDRIVFKKQGGESFFRETNVVLTALGRVPSVDINACQRLGIEYDLKSGIVINEKCQTTNPRVFACGDVTGKLMLAHTAYHQAKVIADTIIGKENKTNYYAIPRIIYSNPEVFSVGLTENECKSRGIEHIAKSLPMTYSGKYFAEHGKDGAKAKMIVDKEKQILGLHLIGNSELSLIAEIMISNRMRIEDLNRIVYPHPTHGEIINELSALFK